MKKILDVCCGSKMFWFNKNDERVLFGDIRREEHILCDERKLIVNPDLLIDFVSLPFESNKFKLVVFDPPHLERVGDKSWTIKKYGKLRKNWKEDIKCGFSECFRVLELNGILIFKWNETQIKLSDILKLTNEKPLFGHRSGKASKTHWVCFMKSGAL